MKKKVLCVSTLARLYKIRDLLMVISPYYDVTEQVERERREFVANVSTNYVRH